MTTYEPSNNHHAASMPSFRLVTTQPNILFCSRWSPIAMRHWTMRTTKAPDAPSTIDHEAAQMMFARLQPYFAARKRLMWSFRSSGAP